MARQGEFLKSQKILRLATISQSNTPHIVPVWYMYESDKIYIGTNTRTKKVQNIKKNSSVSFCVDEGIFSPIYGIMGQGTAKLILETQQVETLAKKILLQYFDSMGESAKMLLDDTDCIIEITPEKLKSWSF